MTPAIAALTLILTAAPATQSPQPASAQPASAQPAPSETAPPPQAALPQPAPPQPAPPQVGTPQAVAPQTQQITHEAAVEIIARATAAELVTSLNCNDILFNQTLLDELTGKLNVGDADKPAIDKEVRASIIRLQKVLRASRNKKDWCDAMLKLYGPEGTFVPRLMKR